MADEPPKMSQRERDARFVGDDGEAAAWAKSLTGSAPAPVAPLAKHERDDIEAAAQAALDAGDMEEAGRILDLLDDPVAYREEVAGDNP